MSQVKVLYTVRPARPEDIPEIIELCKAVYVGAPPWALEQLTSHQKIFPDGQLVAVSNDGNHVMGMASSLIVNWDDYEWETPWRDFTDSGMFTNHDTSGRTLYGAEIMVHPSCRRTGAGKLLYEAREDLVKRLGLLRIRAGARLREYHTHAATMSAQEYVTAVIEKQLVDRTLSFQLRRGFHVLKVVAGYLRHDPESLGYAAVIEWINPKVAKPKDYEYRRLSKYYRKPHP